MKRVAFLTLAVLAMTGTAFADNLTGGALICHTVPDLGYTTWVEEFGGEAPLSWWCQQLAPLASCDDQVNAIYGDDDTFYDNFYILAAWAEPKVFCAVEFGLGAYDTGLVSFPQHGACGVDPATIPTTDPAWPQPNSGIAVAWAVVNAPSGNFVPVYFFGCYLYGSYYGSTMMPLTTDPATDFAGFASCEVPPVTYDVFEMGAMGINEEGLFACGIPIPLEACCFGAVCELLTEEDCITQGGDFYGGPCDPNPCPGEFTACCLCDMSCLLVSAEEECYACGGVYWFPEIHSCDPNPCPPCTHPCCFEDGSCQDLSCMGCEELGGAWHTEWESCDPNPCPRPEFACCFIDGSCEVTTEELCLELGGDPHPEWPECDGADCPILIGACCFCSPPPDCLDNVFEDECYQMGGVAWFAGEDCENVDCWEYTPAHLDSWGEIKEKYRR